MGLCCGESIVLQLEPVGLFGDLLEESGNIDEEFIECGVYLDGRVHLG